MNWEMRMSKILYEKSLVPEVLKDLIDPIISIDEYEPKMDSHNIVIMFQVLNNFDAAYDLSSFIEKSPEEVVDTEAAETPNIDGKYNVFVEMERSVDFPTKFLSLLKDIENVCPNPGWKLQLYKVNDPIDLDTKKMAKNLNLKTDDEELKEFFDYAPVEVTILEEGFTLKSIYGSELTYSDSSTYISESRVKELIENGVGVDTSKLSSVLGEGYVVLEHANTYIVGRNGKYLVLR